MSHTRSAARAALRALVRLPPAVARRLYGPPARGDDGRALDPQTHALLRVVALGSREIHTLGVERARREMERSTWLFADPVTDRVASRDAAADGPSAGARVPVRIYTPETGAAPRPVVVYYHGGGFVIGSLRAYDDVCRAIAARTGALVVSVDYRLAPEHRFPAAVDDCVAAFRWVAREARALGGDPSRVAVMGDSAGGNLAAVVSQQTRGDAARPAFQSLVYPATDMTRSHASHARFAEGFLLTRGTIDWFRDQYLGGDPALLTDPRASPLLAADLSGLPPAAVYTAGFDPLRDEGRAYAEKLRAAGVPATHTCYDGLIHGYFSMGGVLDAARATMDDACRALREAFAVRVASASASP